MCKQQFSQQCDSTLETVLWKILVAHCTIPDTSTLSYPILNPVTISILPPASVMGKKVNFFEPSLDIDNILQGIQPEVKHIRLSILLLSLFFHAR